jgi:hypothetical protein
MNTDQFRIETDGTRFRIMRLRVAGVRERGWFRTPEFIEEWHQIGKDGRVAWDGARDNDFPSRLAAHKAICELFGTAAQIQLPQWRPV